MATKKRQGKIRLDRVKALVEFERIGLKYEPAGESEIKLCCPACKEKNPSLSFNTEKNVWKCHSGSCGKTGDIASLLAYALNVDRTAVLFDLSSRYDLEIIKTISPEVIEKFHKDIWNAGPLLKELRERGITEPLIRKARLGFHSGRITIPIYDRQGRVINIRRYLPGAPGPEKMKNTPGYGGTYIYQIEQLKYPKVWICGGEMKALVTGGLLNTSDIGAVCATAGEGNWDASLSKLFEDKMIYVCNDVDQAGMESSNRIAGYIFNSVKAVYITKLPLDPEKYPKGDINDYVGCEGATADDLLQMMKDAEQWFPPELEDQDDSDPVSILLSQATNAKYVGKKIEVEGIVTSMDTTPYLIPGEVDVSCDKNQPNCAWCPIKPKKPNEKGIVEARVNSVSSGILEMVNSPKKNQREAIREALRIPPCKVAEFSVKSHLNVLDLRMSPRVNIGDETSKNIVQPVLCVTHSVDMNSPYIMRGKVYPHPRNQQAVLLLNDVEAGEDSLTSFNPTEEQLAALAIFQPKEWSLNSLRDKIKSIYQDFESNVTRIFQRRDLHLTIDLCYHSVLVFDFDGRETNGWMNVLVVGDSAQGKTETAQRLRFHYGLGSRHDCKNATVAGLLGGLHQVGNRWFVSWGHIPMNDRGLVILEEIKGARPEVITALTDMRSSGIAELSMIERRSAYARTRLIFISNPRSMRPVSEYNFAIEIISELLDGLEDIRRFDFAIITSSSQVDLEIINKLSIDRPKIEHRYTSELCQRLVLWAWTRRRQDVVFTQETTRLILKRATEMSRKYSESLPLVDRGTMRHKLARMAAALAARTFSTEDLEKLVVRPCHVEAVCEFIYKVYDDASFGYGSFSEAQINASKIQDPKLIETQIKGTRYPRDLVENLLFTDEITLADFNDWCELDQDAGVKMLSFFVRKRAIYRVKSKRAYVKTSGFILLLKSMKNNGVAQVAQTSSDEEF